ncbi:uncharacterized protein (DUF305 family) [Ilumatobacter fluminis]|uniref:Uncharacterized protein (DUF305 family) n=1 Tax=Ilumatobacter fluminis TaxID=467091 RepID=A0A4V3EJD1_9ACTN|nr:DUF305 domain-containing protein [Ilumatobacter fluminis]TDT16788.1 uncharacterized protein (DUF305 family) [Ilumatobacter fluminis]
MKFDKKFRRVSAITVAVGALAVAAVASAGPPSGKGGGKKPKDPPATTTTVASPPVATYNGADIDFVAMMIPHHFQATVMGDLAPERAADESVAALADRIGVEQDVEIGMMQNWQTWNSLVVTDAESSYEMMLSMPMMVEQMGMASPDEMDELAASSGVAFDRLYLELMIGHHEGALAMLTEVLIDGSDTTLEFWATDMLSAQGVQIDQMEAMLAELG